MEKVIEKVFQSVEIHKLDKESFSMEKVQNLSDTFVNDSYNINIIAYGKSFEYYLKYINFILGKPNITNINIPPINITDIPYINITFFCDENTYQHIKNGIKTFELPSNIIIRFVHSSDRLMYGIGAKRAIIQKLMVDNMIDYGMTIDDNIISLHNHYSSDVPIEFETNSECRKRYVLAEKLCDRDEDNTKTKFTPVESEPVTISKERLSVQDSTRKTSTRSNTRSGTRNSTRSSTRTRKNYKTGGMGGYFTKGEKKEILNEKKEKLNEKKEKLNEKKEKLNEKKEILKDCTQWNIIQLYTYLKNEAPKDWWVVGVAKGDGYPDESTMRNSKIFINTTSVYKLAYMNYKELEKNKIRYNPYHTTFLEDVIFNSHPSLTNHIGVCSKIQLRFAHPFVNGNYSTMDYNDCYDSDPDFYKGPTVFKPVFFIKYLEELKNKGYRLDGYESKTKKYIKIGTDLISTGSGKYSYFHFIVILLYMMKHTSPDILLGIAKNTPNFFKGLLDYKILQVVNCERLKEGEKYPFKFNDDWEKKLLNLLKLEKKYLQSATISTTDSNEYTNTLNELKELNFKIQKQINSGDGFILYIALGSALPECYDLYKKRTRNQV